MTARANKSKRVFIACWGTHFKSARHASLILAQFPPLLKRGWQCWLVLEQRPVPEEWIAEFSANDIRIVYLPRPRGEYDRDCVKRIYALCKNLECDVFHCYNMHTSPLIGAFLAGTRVRVWSKLAMQKFYEECRAPRFGESVAVSTRLSCLLATRVVANSHAVAGQLLDLGVREDKVFVMYRPLPDGAGRRHQREPIRESLNYAPQHVVTATIGHAVPVKGWDLLLEAWARVVEAEPCARLLLIGSTSAPFEVEFFRQLMTTVKERNLEPSVQFLGHVPDVMKYLVAADLFVLPSRSEGYCVALVEAAAAGLPCVAARVGIAEEVIRDGENGFLVERNDSLGLAQCLSTLSRDAELRARFAQATAVPASVPTVEQYNETMAKLYVQLLDESDRASR